MPSPQSDLTPWTLTLDLHYNAHKFDIVKGRLKVKFTHRFFRPLCNVEISSFDAASENW